ncbi:EAL domain-containing protein [Lentzea sp. NBRC 105346]|uniref:EAL domain-containing protein n=1 Tax=Lentzea sp. NBRC 105346 TaxID=3032205 RepID=UPI00255478EF|nr:EAL domain-containing protein [Lentzea sp. NBRC 105346]
MSSYVAQVHALTWRPVDDTKRQMVLEAILGGHSADNARRHDAVDPAAAEALEPVSEVVASTVDAWVVAIARNSYLAMDHTQLRTQLMDFAQQMACWLADPVSARLSPALIGRQLAYDLELSTSVLRHTLEVLGPFTEQIQATSAHPDPEQRARLLGGLAEGFTDGARQRVLDEQMAIADAVDRAHRKQHEALVADPDRFESSFPDSRLGMCLMDDQGRITQANHALEILLGQSGDRIVGRTLTDFVLNEDDARQVQRACEEVLRHHRTVSCDAIELLALGRDCSLWASMTITWVPDRDGSGHAHVVMDDVTDSHLWHSRLDQAAARDDTTELPNRQCLQRRLDDVLRAAGPRGTVGLCVVGLDEIDSITGALGSTVSENLIKVLASRLRGATGGVADLVARHDRTSFCVVITDSAMWGRVDELVENMSGWLSETVHLGDYEFAVMPRIGVVRAAAGAVTAEELVLRAEQVLQHTAASTRRRPVITETRRGEGDQWRSHLLAELPAGIDNRELELAYIPIVDPHDATLAGAEAAVHWRHPEHGDLRIDDLLTMADDIGLDLGLTPWMLQQAARQARIWWDTLGSDTPFVAINIPRRLTQGDRLVDDVRTVLTVSRARPEHLRLGLNHAGSPTWRGVKVEHLVSLSALGIPLRLNDFGSSFERFDLLPQVTIEGIAVPPGLTSRLGGTKPEHQCCHAITSALVSMAHNLELTVTLQGVDTLDQLHAAQALEARFIQGKLVGPSAPPQEISRRVRLDAHASMQALVEAS